jgi:CheY-like chemotaxis protein
VNAARAVGGADLKLVVLGTINDVGLLRDLLSAGASDYLVKPSTREALAALLEKKSVPVGTTPDGLGQVIVFVGSRGGDGATTTAVGCGWLTVLRDGLGGRGLRRRLNAVRDRAQGLPARRPQRSDRCRGSAM